MNKSFGNKLRLLRTQQGLYQKDLAAELGVSREIISYWESGKKKPNIDTILKLCDILDTNPNELLDYTPKKK